MVRLEDHKQDTEFRPIEILAAPRRACIPLSQHLGQMCLPLVKAGDTVTLGQKIGSVEAHVFSPVHASVSGRVVGVQEWPHPVLGACTAVVIDNAEPVKPLYFHPHSENEAALLSPEQIRGIIFEAGIVGMGGAGFPSHIKLNQPKPIQSLIINGSECEPYLTGDSRLMVERSERVARGIELVARCLGRPQVYIAVEDNNPDAATALSEHARSRGYKIVILPSSYPQGGEKQLVKSVLRREVPRGKLPFDVGVVVHNVATVHAVYEAVYVGKPLYERMVTVAGSCLSRPKNLLARIGTPIQELINVCGPLTADPARIIVGGPMMGIAQGSTDVPVIKTTTGVLLLNEKEAQERREEFCIRCGACVRECPAGLMPTMINLAAEREMWAEAKAYDALDCIECGLCSYVCPANRRLTPSIRRAKGQIHKMRTIRR